MSEAAPAGVSTTRGDQATATDRVLRLVDFLEAYDARRNPPVHAIDRYGLYVLPEAKLRQVPGVELAPAGESWLTVDFVELPPRPVPPVEVASVLANAELSPHVRPVVTQREEPTEEDSAAAALAEAWVTQVWEPWAAAWRDAQAAKALYRDLFEVRARLETDRDAVELVWGFGRLRWSPDGVEPIDHPLLIVPVEIDHDAATNQIRVRPGGAVEVESLFLSDVELDDRAAYVAVRQSFRDLDDPADPWDAEQIRDVLRRLVRAVDHDGVIEGEGAPTRSGAVVDPSWVLFLRRRRPDYQGFLDVLRDLYRDGVAPPAPLSSLVVDAPSTLVGGPSPALDSTTPWPAPSPSQGQPLQPLLLPLATNEEQQRIIELARTRPGVVVQGPPGTGKSHTIANIISHYVAYGRRVLVVAEKEQALRVLADKVPEGIRDLTVSVLGSDEDGRRRLESSITQIQTKVTAIDRAHADAEIERLTAALDRIDRDIAAVTGRLLSARAAEVASLEGAWDAGSPLTPSTAGKWLAEHPELGYIADPLTPDVTPPLAEGELAELVALIGSVGVERAEACGFELPDLGSLPSATALADLFARLDELDAVLAQAGSVAWEAVDRAGPSIIDELAGRVGDELAWAVKVGGSWLARVAEQAGDHLLRDTWMSFVAAMHSEREQLVTIGRELEAHQVNVPDTPEPGFADALRAAQERLASKGKLGMFAGEARKAVGACSVDGRPPATAADVALCLHALRRAELRRQISNRWSNRAVPAGAPPLGDETMAEELGRHLDDLDRILAGAQRWAELSPALAAAGVTPPIEPTADALSGLAEVLSLVQRRSAQRSAQGELDTLGEYLAGGSSGPDASPLWRLLGDALATRRTEQWATLRAQVEDLAAIAPQALRLRRLRDQLAATAPVWTQSILSDPTAAGDPTRLRAAWQWRQLETWLAGVRAGGDPAELQHQLEQLAERRRRTVADLVTERAWRRLADNLGDRQRQALNSYLQAVKRYGKTGGKYAARWLNQARIALNESKDAVPVWIMPTSRALNSFRPDREPPFDVLVIDEASQLGIDALPLLSLARSTIVVGDDQQTSPENVGLDQQAVFNLLDEYLSVVPKYQTLFDASNSLYDLAFQKFPDSVMLTEHFRSLPEIIAFSSQLSYDRRIIPLRDQPPAPGWKALGAVRVEGGYRSGYVNEPEADAVVDLVAELCADPAYDQMTFGVVSLLGTSQSKLIWDKLFDRLGGPVIEERKLRCGEPANFQGDERDVIVISTVAATDPANPTRRPAAMTRLHDKRRVNVAASRARHQMWVVHSLDPDRFADGDYRAGLIRHCYDPGRAEETLTGLEARCESDFERRVLNRILARGYTRVKVQHTVGRFRIDVVVEGPHTRLAVECDGDAWHGEDAWHRDRQRQQVLERAGWTFERIRGSAFYRDPESALEPLWARLDQLGIPTGDDWVGTSSKPMVRTVPAAVDAAARDGEKPAVGA